MASVSTLTARLTARLAVTAAVTADFSPPTVNVTEDFALSLTYGTTVDKADQTWSDQRTLDEVGGSTPTEDLALEAGTITNALGVALELSIVKFLLINNRSTTGDLLVGGAVANQFVTPFGDATDKIRIRRGGFLALGTVDATGYAVATDDVLKIANEDTVNTLTYDIHIVGVD